MAHTLHKPQPAAEWFAGKSFEELHAIEAGGALYFPDALRERNAKGEIIEHPVLLKPPTKHDRALGKIDAIKHVAALRPKSKCETVEQAASLVGAEVFEDLDTIAIVARCVHERQHAAGTEPARYMLLDLLLKRYQPATLFDVWDRLEMLASAVDVRSSEVTEEQFWGAVFAIQKHRNLSPLAVFDGSAQRNFMLRMAEELSNYRTPKSGSASSENST